MVTMGLFKTNTESSDEESDSKYAKYSQKEEEEDEIMKMINNEDPGSDLDENLDQSDTDSDEDHDDVTPSKFKRTSLLYNKKIDKNNQTRTLSVGFVTFMNSVL